MRLGPSILRASPTHSVVDLPGFYDVFLMRNDEIHSHLSMDASSAAALWIASAASCSCSSSTSSCSFSFSSWSSFYPFSQPPPFSCCLSALDIFPNAIWMSFKNHNRFESKGKKYVRKNTRIKENKDWKGSLKPEQRVFLPPLTCLRGLSLQREEISSLEEG